MVAVVSDIEYNTVDSVLAVNCGSVSGAFVYRRILNKLLNNGIAGVVATSALWMRESAGSTCLLDADRRAGMVSYIIATWFLS